MKVRLAQSVVELVVKIKVTFGVHACDIGGNCSRG